MGHLSAALILCGTCQCFDALDEHGIDNDDTYKRRELLNRFMLLGFIYI